VPSQEVPSIDHATLDMSVVKLMVDLGLVNSLSAARRAIRDGGAYINNRTVSDETYTLSSSDVLDGGFVILRRGKKSVGGVIAVCEVLAGAKSFAAITEWAADAATAAWISAQVKPAVIAIDGMNRHGF
jgi:hypothetical protein